MDEPPRTLTPAERCYERQKKAQRDYYRRKHPNPRPVGRPKKVATTPAKPAWDDCGLCNEGVYYMGEGDTCPCPFCLAPYEK